MTQFDANKKMVGLFEKMVAVAEEAAGNDNKEDLTLFTDNAHKLYITLTESGAFGSGLSSLPDSDFSS